jgi:excisionase family DNA binding protein
MPRLVKASEVARLLNCSAKTVRKEAKAGNVPSVRIGKGYRFDPAAVILALSNQPTKGQR